MDDVLAPRDPASGVKRACPGTGLMVCNRSRPLCISCRFAQGSRMPRALRAVLHPLLGPAARGPSKEVTCADVRNRLTSARCWGVRGCVPAGASRGRVTGKPVVTHGPLAAATRERSGLAQRSVPPFNAAIRARIAAPCSDRRCASLARPRAALAFA